MTILSKADRDFWEENGYIVVPNAVSPALRNAVVDATWSFLDMDPHDPSTWYSLPPWHSRAGMVELYHHQALWDTRQDPRIHQIYSELFARDDLWVRLDRVNMNPPVKTDHDYKGFIHWDFDPTTWPIDLRVQGVLCLTRTTAAQGGFQCVPGSHKIVDKILSWQEPGADLRNPDIRDLEIVPIEGEAGDLVIWHTALLHGNGPNRTDQPRLAQYIAMMPADPAQEELRQAQIQRWRHRWPMGHLQPRAFPSDPRQRDETAGPPAHLTNLGRKLVGLDSW